jgi:hypothetical protein
MGLLPQQLARRDGPSTDLRDEPLRLEWTFDDLLTRDAHVLRVRFACSTVVGKGVADRRMFAEVFLGSRTAVTTEDVIRHFDAPLRQVAAEAASTLGAREWVGQHSADMQVALVKAGNATAFACGLEILPPYHVEIESLTLQRQQFEAMERVRAEERVAGQVQHFQRATELLRQFQSLREQMPGLSPGRLLEQINPIDRGTTLQSLLMASGTKSQQQILWAVAGPNLVKIDAAATPPEVKLMPLPDNAGPLRSVQSATINGRPMLLVGARCGVMVLSPDSPAEARIYLDPTVQTQLGFNRVVAHGNEVWASHGEAGVVGWMTDTPERPPQRFSANPAGGESGPAPPPLAGARAVSGGGSPSLVMSAGGRTARPSAPRNLQVLDDAHLVYSIGNEILILPGGGEPHALPGESPAEIVAILPAERTLFVVHSDSTIGVLSRQTRRIIDRQRRAGSVCAAGALPWLESVRLLLVDSEGTIDCVGFDDPLITQYVGPHRGLRSVTASSALIAAISGDRQRIILWQTWDGRAPAAEIHVTSLARHRVADLDFG